MTARRADSADMLAGVRARVAGPFGLAWWTDAADEFT